MHLQPRRLALRMLLLSTATALAGCAEDTETTAGNEGGDELVGGSVVPDGAASAVLSLEFGPRFVVNAQGQQVPNSDHDTCTGTAVSRRHILTAAHCVLDKYGNLRSMRPGAYERFSVRLSEKTYAGSLPESALFQAFLPSYVGDSADDVRNFGIVPSAMLNRCIPQNLCNSAWTASAASSFTDLAILTLDRDLPASILSVPVDLRMVNDEKLYTVGFGCENGNTGGGVVGRKNWGYTTTEAPKGLTLTGNIKANPQAFAVRYLFSRGVKDPHAASAAAAGNAYVGICSGDSGGPLFRSGAVVGVTSNNVWWQNDPTKKSATNLFARVRGAGSDPDALQLWFAMTLPPSSLRY